MRLKRTGIFTKIIIAALLIYAAISLINLSGEVQEAEAAREELKDRRAEITASIDEIEYALDHRDDDKVIEDIARGEGYVYPNEEVYYAD